MIWCGADWIIISILWYVQKNGKFIVNIMTDDGITIEYGIPIVKQSKSQSDLDIEALRNLLDPI